MDGSQLITMHVSTFYQWFIEMTYVLRNKKIIQDPNGID